MENDPRESLGSRAPSDLRRALQEDRTTAPDGQMFCLVLLLLLLPLLLLLLTRSNGEVAGPCHGVVLGLQRSAGYGQSLRLRRTGACQ